MIELGDTLYRYTDYWSVKDTKEIEMRQYKVVKKTPFGVWVTNHEMFGQEKWMKYPARRQFAHTTKLSAMESFIARKNMQRMILQTQLDGCEQVRDNAKKMYEDMTDANTI
jgi:hypothetical protein